MVYTLKSHKMDSVSPILPKTQVRLPAEIVSMILRLLDLQSLVNAVLAHNWWLRVAWGDSVLQNRLKGLVIAERVQRKIVLAEPTVEVVRSQPDALGRYSRLVRARTLPRFTGLEERLKVFLRPRIEKTMRSSKPQTSKVLRL